MTREHPSHRRPDRPIRSAELVALIRAMSRKQRATWRHSPDSMAELFVRWRDRPCLWLSRPLWLLSEAIVPGSCYYHVARSRHFDALLVKAVDEGIEQLVILGAGYDSRPYRFRHRLGGVTIFELDLPGTQERKKRRLRAALTDLPDHVTYVAVDFNHTTLDGALSAVGYRNTAKTFFMWEGVMPYLPEPAIVSVFDFVANQSGVGSSIAFDYLLRSFLDDPSMIRNGRLALRQNNRVGEPLITGYEPADLERLVLARGLTLASDLGSRELGARYCVDPKGRVFEPLACFRMAHAVQSSSTKNTP
ncbi:MAG: SAM-dependent methyltransferase [Acidobacteriota bacterium]